MRRKPAPADLKKDAGGFELPIGLGLLLGSGQVALDRPGSFAIVGELALTGETRPIKGVLAMALQAAAENRDGLLVPAANAPEAAVVEGLNVIPIASLAEAVGFLSGRKTGNSATPPPGYGNWLGKDQRANRTIVRTPGGTIPRFRPPMSPFSPPFSPSAESGGMNG